MDRWMALLAVGCGGNQDEGGRDPDGVGDADADADGDTDADTDVDTHTGTAPTGDTGTTGATGDTGEVGCWSAVAAESVVCFMTRSENRLRPPEVAATTPSRLLALGLDTGASCGLHTWDLEIVEPLDLAVAEGRVAFCESGGSGGFPLLAVEPRTGALSTGARCLGNGALTAHGATGLALDETYYNYGDWKLFPTLADAQASVRASPWSILPKEAGGWTGASEDGGVLYVYDWPYGEMAAWELTLGTPAAFVAPDLPRGAFVVGMEVLDGVVYLLELDREEYFLATHDPATGLETSRRLVGSVATDAMAGLACVHP